MKKLIFLELNEINIEYVKFYISKGFLPNWRKIIDQYGVQITESERVYENIEPWIQWPTIRTGQEYSEHKIFRLGDVCNSSVMQHWEIFEELGLTVAAISPINAANNTKNALFWIPDPWVDTRISGDNFVHRLAVAIKQAVNDNAEGRVTFKTCLVIIEAFLTKTKISSWPSFICAIFGVIRGQRWSSALILDRLLVDIYLALWKKYQPHFSTLFLNAGAHIQHHYMYNSLAYDGPKKNPEWYVSSNADPLLDILKVYDLVLLELLKIPRTRLIVASGMQQVPYHDLTFYWRLKNHEIFLRNIGLRFKRVKPRMTRDFLIEFDNSNDAIVAERTLSSFSANDGREIFGEIDNRGVSIFVTLTYPKDIDRGSTMEYLTPSQERRTIKFKDNVVFVAIKNGHHDGSGFLIDSDCQSTSEAMPIHRIFNKLINHFKARDN